MKAFNDFYSQSTNYTTTKSNANYLSRYFKYLWFENGATK